MEQNKCMLLASFKKAYGRWVLYEKGRLWRQLLDRLCSHPMIDG